jgi:hypothetical protein
MKRDDSSINIQNILASANIGSSIAQPCVTDDQSPVFNMAAGRQWLVVFPAPRY